MSFEELITRYGYIALLAGTFFEGETVLILGAFAAHQGYLEIGWVLLAAFFGAFAGDEFYFFLGRVKGKSLLEKWPSWRTRAKTVEALLSKYHALVIVGFRFIYGLRTVTPFVIGLSKVPTSQFVFYNATGTLCWTVAIGTAGFLFGRVFEALLDDVKKYERFIIFAVFGAGMLMWLIYYGRRRPPRMTG